MVQPHQGEPERRLGQREELEVVDLDYPSCCVGVLLLVEDVLVGRDGVVLGGPSNDGSGLVLLRRKWC